MNGLWHQVERLHNTLLFKVMWGGYTVRKFQLSWGEVSSGARGRRVFNQGHVWHSGTSNLQTGPSVGPVSTVVDVSFPSFLLYKYCVTTSRYLPYPTGLPLWDSTVVKRSPSTSKSFGEGQFQCHYPPSRVELERTTPMSMEHNYAVIVRFTVHPNTKCSLFCYRARPTNSRKVV